jgi:hypothetical protein
MHRLVNTPIPPKRWKQLVWVLLEISLFLLFWFLLNLGIFSGYFAILLVIALAVVIYFSFRNNVP